MMHLNTSQLFDQAISHHEAGRLAEAERLYRQILSQQPKHADSLHLLGVLAGQTGQHAKAIDLIGQAIAASPNVAVFHANLGQALQNSVRSDQAIAAYRQAVRLQPELADLHNTLGNLLSAAGKLDEAIAAYRQAIRFKVNNAEALSNLGNALIAKGQLDEAIATYRQAIRLKPDYADAYNNLGNLLRDKKQTDEAIAIYRQAIRLKPDWAEAHSNLGVALRDKGQIDDAIAAYRQATRLKQDYPVAHNNLACALESKGLIEEAIASYRETIRLKPDYPEAHNNLAVALRDKGQIDDAVASYRQALRLKPDYAECHLNLALVLLTQGNFQAGWEEYEWRWKSKEFPSPARNFTQPQWEGQPLENRTLLLHTEQGLGDSIQFIRYLPLVSERLGNQSGAKIVVDCTPELHRLFQTISGNWSIIARGNPLPAFDFHCPLLSLPRIFATHHSNIPASIPYLSAEPALIEKWREKIGPANGHFRVGLVWAGNPKYKGDRTRSLSLKSLAPLAAISGIKFYSLQKGPASDQLKNPPAEMQLIDLAPDLNDFADTAAVVTQLDLVIAVDTAAAHLVGALGKPIWTLVPFASDWRWQINRTDSPWYPTMRLFRQTQRDDWDSVVANLADALSALPKQSLPTPA